LFATLDEEKRQLCIDVEPDLFALQADDHRSACHYNRVEEVL
jgi:hypothetical protein